MTFSDFENHMLTQHGITKWDLNEDGVRVVVSQKQRKRGHHHHPPHIGKCAGILIKTVKSLSCHEYH